MSCPEWKAGRCLGCLKEECRFWPECQALPCTLGTGGKRLDDNRLPLLLFGAAAVLIAVFWMVLA